MTSKTSNEVQVDVHRESSETASSSGRRREPHSLLEQTTTADSRSNQQTQLQQNQQTQLQQTLEQGFGKMATSLSTAIENAFKNFSDKFDVGPIEDELLTELEEGELERNGNANGSDGENGRQNDRHSQEEPDVSDGTNVQRMIERAKTQNATEQAKEPSVLDGIRGEMKTAETGPKFNDDLAEIVNGLVQKGLSEEKLQDKLNKYPSPENCEALSKMRVNQLIWDNLQPNSRSQDLRFQKVQTALIKGMAAIVRATDTALAHITTLPAGKEIVESMTDAIALCAHANSELNIRRKELIKPDLHEDYKHLCSASVPSSSQLFGDDLSKQVKDLTEVNKVGRKMTRHKNKPYARAPAYSYRGRNRNIRPKPFLGERQVASASLHFHNKSIKIGGRLKQFIHFWEKLTSDKFILETIAGYKIEFKPEAICDHNWSRNPETKFNDKEQCIIDNEIDKLMCKGVIEVTQHSLGEFISPIFIRAKKDGSHRLILNLKELNTNVEYHHFIMETLQSAVALMRPGSLEMLKSEALKSSKGNFEPLVSTNNECVEDLQWWVDNIENAFKPVERPEADMGGDGLASNPKNTLIV
ncbi:Hypothetical predicted protein [Paramuricea clavata]|uniref:Uncharacterized protein n=1 Tax=Paramuricea clavata TaxID=317549 RepID=A0A6S7GIX2_PARCT|nr:Hypothetical predicted protein [Paramuricea clavata]